MSNVRVEYDEKQHCGCYMSYLKKDGDKDGGLRTRGIYKTDTVELPLITYITVVYNRVDTMRRCMDSVFAQTYPNVEYIVVDGASTDGTLQLIEENADKIDYYISQPDTGIYNAMNKGIALARGRFLCFMNSDDECVPDAALKAVEEYKRTGADIVCGVRDLYVNGVHQEELTYPRYAIKHSNFRYIQMYHQATYASYEVFNKIGGFDERYSLLADWIWESAAIDADFKVSFFNEVLTKFNYDGASAKGIIKRDNEWIEWTMRSFPSLSKEAAELFVYSLDRSRFPMFDLKVLKKEADKYREDLCFQKAFYEDSLMACIEANIDLENMAKNAKYNLDKRVKRNRFLKKEGNVQSFEEIKCWLDKQLKESIELNDFDYFNKKKHELESLLSIREFQIKTSGRIYMRGCFYSFSYVVGAVARYVYYMVGLLAGKQRKSSREFYQKARAKWDLE